MSGPQWRLPVHPALMPGTNAALYVESQSHPDQCVMTIGVAKWSIEDFAYGIECVVEADFELAGFGFAMKFRRYVEEPSPPASHVVLVRLAPPPTGILAGSEEVGAPTAWEGAAGQPLKGWGSLPLDGVTTFGLEPKFAPLNRYALEHCDQITVPILLKDDRIASVTLDVGTAERRLIGLALDAAPVTARATSLN